MLSLPVAKVLRKSNARRRRIQATSPIVRVFRVVSSGCGRNSDLTEVYVDNMHKNHAVQVTVRKHTQEGDDDTNYAIAEGGQLFLGCEGAGTSFAVVGCKVLKAEVEQR